MRIPSRLSLRADLAITIAASLSLAVSLVAFNAVAAHLLSKEDFGRLISARNIAVFFVPLLTLSQAIALPRFMAMHGALAEIRTASLQITLLIAGIAFAAVLMLEGFFSDAIGGDVNKIVVLLLSLGLGGARLLESLLRGSEEVVLANIVKGPVNAAVLLLSLVGMILQPQWLVGVWVQIVGYGVLFLAYVYLASSLRGFFGNAVKEARRELVVYGVTRTPAGLLKAALFSNPFFVFLHFEDYAAAAVFGIGLYFIRLAEAFVTGASPSIVFRSAKMLSENREKHFAAFAVSLFEAVFFLSSLLLVLFVVFGEFLVGLLFGPQYTSDYAALLPIVICMLPYTLFVCLRGFIDVAYDRPINTYLLIIAVLMQLLVFLMLSGSSSRLHAMSIATLCAVVVLALGGVLSLLSKVAKGVSLLEMAKTAFAISVVYLLALVAEYLIAPSESEVLKLATAAGLILLALLMAWAMKLRWIEVLVLKSEIE